MENIKKQIYTLPEIGRVTKPLWSAWAVTIIGIPCGIIGIFNSNISSTTATDLICCAIVGVMSLVLTLCYYLFGDSRRPYHKDLHKTLEPTIAYYDMSEQQRLISALENKNEQTLAKIKKIPQPGLVLMRYSDKEETIYYSQVLSMSDNKQLQPLTNLIINNLNN